MSLEMNTLKAWSDDEDESSSEVLDEGEDEVDDIGCALGLTQVGGKELLQGHGGSICDWACPSRRS